ncbi:NAD(P)/FAD-dependent oxidoreductase [Allohahella marinimesophila]|uniref:FAD-dependent oxidoreductase n=1 Tax=Allohahella marinimesophila TaxID=1054972 RepID=A0ABP7PDI0_9GAMM
MRSIYTGPMARQSVSGQKIAIVGAGVSGLTCAFYLAEQNEVTVYEANAYLGGHTDTHELLDDGRAVTVDSGFIVFNEYNYTGFTRLLNALGVESEPSDMSFSVVNEGSGLEYGAAGLARLFAQKRNLLSPRFYRMLRDIVRFYREAPRLLDDAVIPEKAELSLGDYLERERYSQDFIENHILPMASALWSASSQSILAFPARYFVAFMNNHQMLNLTTRPEWRVVKGGSSAYVKALRAQCRATFHCNSKVASVSRQDDETLRVRRADGSVEIFDQVIFACHSDQALDCLEAPSQAEREVLGAIRYQPNQAMVHTDVSVLPARRSAWSSWNVRIDKSSEHDCRVSYWMNLLQNIRSDTQFIVSLNMADRIDPSKILAERHYSHPIYDAGTIAAQRRRGDINGSDGIWYAGAYWGWGFHEDGVRSALDVIDGLAHQQSSRPESRKVEFGIHAA